MMTQRRFQLRRVAGKLVVTCSQELAAYAEKLGQVADELAAADPLPPPLRVFQDLYEVSQPQQPHGCQPFSNERLLALAAATSLTAAVSSRQELYPRGMAAERALRLGIGALRYMPLQAVAGSLTLVYDRETGKYEFVSGVDLKDILGEEGYLKFEQIFKTGTAGFLLR